MIFWEKDCEMGTTEGKVFPWFFLKKTVREEHYVMKEDIQNVAYLNILNDTLSKKLDALKKLTELTEEQAVLIKAEEIDMDAFEATIDKKAVLIDRLTALDQGFLDLYEKAKARVELEPEKYKDELTRTKALVAEITERSTSLEALEERNKTGLSIQLSKGKQKVKEFKVNSRTAAAYYKNMSNSHKEGDSYFLDRKK